MPYGCVIVISVHALLLEQTLQECQSVFEHEALRMHLDRLCVQQYEELKLNPDDLEVVVQYDGSSMRLCSDWFAEDFLRASIAFPRKP